MATQSTLAAELNYLGYWNYLAEQRLLEELYFLQVPTEFLGHDSLRALMQHSQALCHCGVRRVLLPAEPRRFLGRDEVELTQDFTFLGPIDGDARSAFAGLAMRNGQLLIKRLFTPNERLPYQELVDISQGVSLSSPDRHRPTLERSNLQRHPFVLGVRVADVMIPACRVRRQGSRFFAQLDTGIGDPASHKLRRPHRCW